MSMRSGGVAANRRAFQPSRLEIPGERQGRARAGPRIAGEALAPIEVNLHVAADLHGEARPRIDPIEARLRPAPYSKACGELAEDGPGDGEPAVNEQITALE